MRILLKSRLVCERRRAVCSPCGKRAARHCRGSAAFRRCLRTCSMRHRG